MNKVLKVLLIVLGFLFVFLIYVQLTYKQTFEAPAIGLNASSDSTIIARGKYLTTGPGHCWTCHVQDPSKVNLTEGAPATSGGFKLELPFIATLYSPNITSDKKTGIGRYSDEQLARVIRYNITPAGHALIPFMSYNAMSDEDLAAIISYLRASEPVENAVPKHELTLLGKVLLRFVLKPNFSEMHLDFSGARPDTSAVYGKYLAYSVANCNGCHTMRGPTGEYIGKPFAGGKKEVVEGATFIPPNLTPDPLTGRIYQWSQQTFINRFRAGKVFPEEYMPWDAYKHMSDDDLKAIYQFLQTLEPVQYNIDQTYISSKKTQ